MRFDEGKIVIEIKLGNAEMSSPMMAGGLLHQIATEIVKLQDFESEEDVGNYDAGHVRRKFRDVNGNTVASWKHKS